uniref:Putative secreted protein n=1 Tax=Amblyomma tuberculatum TaxID=48802 RepID=A0A6M2E332_9ACAR
MILLHALLSYCLVYAVSCQQYTTFGGNTDWQNYHPIKVATNTLRREILRSDTSTWNIYHPIKVAKNTPRRKDTLRPTNTMSSLTGPLQMAMVGCAMSGYLQENGLQ